MGSLIRTSFVFKAKPSTHCKKENNGREQIADQHLLINSYIGKKKNLKHVITSRAYCNTHIP